MEKRQSLTPPLFLRKNKEAILNFGLIAYGKVSDIEKLQEIIDREFPKINVVYQTVTGKRLWLKKMKNNKEVEKRK